MTDYSSEFVTAEGEKLADETRQGHAEERPDLPDQGNRPRDEASSSSLFGRGLLYVVVAAVQMVTAALASPVLAHLLRDPAAFGSLSTAIALHQLLVVFGLIGLDQAVILKRAQDGHDRDVRALAASAMLLTALVTTALWVSSAAWAGLVGFEPGSELLLATVLWTVPSSGVMVVLGLLLGGDRLRAYALTSLLAVVGGQALGVALVLTVARSATAYAWGLVVADAAAAAVGFFLTRPRWGQALRWDLIRPALAFGAPLMLGSLSNFVLNAGDRIIIQRLAGAAEVGRYQIAYTVGFVAVTLVGLTASAWTPRFAAVVDRGARAVVMCRSRDALYRLLAPVTLGVILASPLLLRIVAPASYEPAGLLPVVLLVLLTAYPVAASGATGRMLITEKRTRVLASWAIVAAVSNVVLNLLLVPVAGVLGAAAATLGAFALQAAGQRFSVGARAWPRTPPRLLVLVLVTVTLASASVELPQTTPWVVARFVLAVACLPWAWLELRRARQGDGDG